MCKLVTSTPCQTDPQGDARYEANGLIGPNTPKLDITGSTVNLDPVDSSKLDVRLKVADLSSLPTAADGIQGGAYVDYLTSWNYHIPGNTQAQYDSTGNIYYAYLEVNTAAPPNTLATAYDGNTCSIATTHPKDLVYPGQHSVTYTINQAAGTIDLFVPRSDVGSPSLGATLYSVTAHTVSQPGSAGPYDCSTRDPNGNDQDPSGQVFNVYDKSAAYTAILSAQSGNGGNCHEGDGNGDITGRQSGTASFNMDADDCEDHNIEHVDYQDSSSGVGFQSTQVTQKMFDDVGTTHSLTVSGVGLLSNRQSTTFVATVVDNGTASSDTFSIVLGNGYTNAGPLVDGTITLH